MHGAQNVWRLRLEITACYPSCEITSHISKSGLRGPRNKQREKEKKRERERERDREIEIGIGIEIDRERDKETKNRQKKQGNKNVRVQNGQKGNTHPLPRRRSRPACILGPCDPENQH